MEFIMDEAPPALATWTLLLVLTLWVGIMAVDWTERSTPYPKQAAAAHSRMDTLTKLEPKRSLQPAAIKTSSRFSERHTP